jgi:hypothetical protein
VCDNLDTARSVIGYILGKEIGMSDSSSDKPSESKRPQPDRAQDDESSAEETSDYYYDDATGYEIYEDEPDEDDETNQDKGNSRSA